MREDPVLEITLLGHFHVKVNREPVSGFESDKVRGLLAYLVVESERPLTRSALAGMFWPERPERNARQNLSQALSNLRSIIGDRDASPPYLLISPQTIQFNANCNSWVDLKFFDNLLQKCDNHPHDRLETCNECMGHLEQAASLGSGEFLEGFSLPENKDFDDWYLIHREKLHRQITSVLNRLIQCCSYQEDYDAALNYAWELLDMDRWREETYQHLMRLLAITGQRSAALAQYETCHDILKDTFGAAPDVKTSALFDKIRTGEIGLSGRPSPRSAQGVFSSPPFVDKDAPDNYQPPFFIGRTQLLGKLFQTLSNSLGGKGQVTFVFGGPGRGKTALIQEFTRRALENHPDLLSSSGSSNAFSGVGDPFLPFREILAVLTGDLETQYSAGTISRAHAQRMWGKLPITVQNLVTHSPFLIDTLVAGDRLIARTQSVVPGETDWLQELQRMHTKHKPNIADLQQTALLEQCANFLQALASHHPLLLVLDDLQWADRGTVNLLFHLGRRLVNSRVMILGAYRPEEVRIERDGARHPLVKVLGEFRMQFGDTWIDLSKVNHQEEQEFVNAYLNTEPNRFDADFKEKFFQRTHGHPLFTIELLRDMEARDYLVQDAEGFWVPGPTLEWNYLPTQVEAVIASRLGRLDQRQRSILEVASVEGNEFTAEVLGRVERLPPNNIFDILDQECRDLHRLVTDLGDTQINGRTLSQYKFNHPLFNTYLYQSLSSGKRRLIHAEVGKSLEALYGDHRAKITIELAYHYDAAGFLEKAAPYLLAAGEQAQISFANDEAIAYFQRVLNLLKGRSVAPRDKKWRLQALQGLGVISMNTGRISEAEQHLTSAIAIGKDIKIPLEELIIIFHWLGEVYIWQNRQKDRIRIGMEGLVLLGHNTESVEAALMNQTVAMGYWVAGDRDKFREYTLRTIKFIRHLPYSTELNIAYVHFAIMYKEDKDVNEALKWLDKLEKQAVANLETRYLGEAHTYKGEISFEMGNFKGALERLERAQGLFKQIGDRGTEPGGSLHLMGWIFLSLGDLQNAAHHIQKSLQTAKAYGVKRWIAKNTGLKGRIYLTRRDWETAAGCFQTALQLSMESNDQNSVLLNSYLLGRVNLALNNPGEALDIFQGALASAAPLMLNGHLLIEPHIAGNLFIGPILCGIETAYEDLGRTSGNGEGGFQEYCQKIRGENPEIGESPFVQRYLEPVEIHSSADNLLLESDLTTTLDDGWTWHDPLGDCRSYHQNGFVIQAVNGRDLWYLNLSAPRLLRPAKGDFTIQTFSTAGLNNWPAIGGLLLWSDKHNYLCLDWGRRGKREISFQGCVDNQDFIIGRGRLPGDANACVYLRLSRSGGLVKAYCSQDGQNWYTVGSCSFPVEDPVEAGLYANGLIPREIYCGDYPDGTAIRFKKFWMWVEEWAVCG